MIKKLLKSVREYKTASIIVPVLMAVEAIMEIVIPFLMTFIVGELQRVAESTDSNVAVNMNTIIICGVLMLVCAVGALIAGAAGAKLAAKASCGFAHNLREDMYNNLQTFSFANIDNYSTASLITRITTDVTNVQNAIRKFIFQLIHRTCGDKIKIAIPAAIKCKLGVFRFGAIKYICQFCFQFFVNHFFILNFTVSAKSDNHTDII